MVRKAAREYSKTKEEQLGQAVKAAFAWFSTCYGAITDELIIETPMDADLTAICEQMGRTPDWIDGLFLRADGYETAF